MKKMLGLMLYGMALFSLAAGTGWFMRSQLSPTVKGTTGLEDPNAAPIPALSNSDWGTPVTTSSTVDTIGTAGARTGIPGAPGTAGAIPDPAARGTEEHEMPTAVRPGQMSVEEIVRLSLGLKTRAEAVRAREEVLKRSEAQYQLLLADMQGEKKEIEGLVAQARDQRLATEELLKKMDQLKRDSDAARQLLEADRKAAQLETERRRAEAERTGTTPAGLEPDLQTTIKSVAPLLENMSPQKGAEAIEQMILNENMELAAGIIGAMDQRKASLLLETISDTQMRNLLLEQQGRKKTAAARTTRGR